MRVKCLLATVILIFPIILFSETSTFLKVVKSVEGKDSNSVSDFLNLLVNVASKTKYNQKAEEFHEYLHKSLEKFDFKDLYHSKYMKPSVNGYKSVTYAGIQSKEGFSVDLLDSTFDKIPNKGFGDFGAELSLRKNELSSVATGSYAKSNSYSGDLKLDQNFGVFSHEKGAVLLSSLLSILDLENLEKINNMPTYKTFSNLKSPENRKLLDLLSLELPSVSRFINQYFEADSILKTQSLNSKRVTLFFLKGRINNRYLQNTYPYLAGYLDDITELGSIRIIIYNSSGERILELDLESATLLLYCKFYTIEGKIIPYSTNTRKDELDFSKAFSISKMSLYNFKINISFQANIYGLEFENKEIVVNGVYSNKAGEGNLNFALKEITKTSVSGGFSYLVPTWAINLAIPGNMEELVFHFTKVLVHANQEKGSSLNLSWRKKPTHWIFSIRSESEFVDNFFIRFGLKVFNYKIRPSKEAGEELSRFLVQIFELTRKDISPAKEKLVF